MSKTEILKARRTPFEIAPTRKSGSKLLMNLVYYVDHEEFATNLRNVETHPSLRWVADSKIKSNDAGVKVTTFRNPYDRFSAFYFENIYLDGPYQWVQWRSALEENGFDYSTNLDVEGHRKNTQILFDYIGKKISQHGVYKVATQYAAQVKTILPALDQGFEVLIYSRLNFELHQRLEAFIPDVDVQIARLFKELDYQLPVHSREIISDSLAKQIRQTYAIDFDFFEAVRYGTT